MKKRSPIASIWFVYSTLSLACISVGIDFADTLGRWKYLPLGLGVILSMMAVASIAAKAIKATRSPPGDQGGATPQGTPSTRR